MVFPNVSDITFIQNIMLKDLESNREFSSFKESPMYLFLQILTVLVKLKAYMTRQLVSG